MDLNLCDSVSVFLGEFGGVNFVCPLCDKIGGCIFIRRWLTLANCFQTWTGVALHKAQIYMIYFSNMHTDIMLGDINLQDRSLS